MQDYTIEQYMESAGVLKAILGDFRPEVLLILGSGLGDLGSQVDAPITVAYEKIPHMKRSTVPGHQGQFVFGRLAGKNVAVMQGRLHAYEGWSFADTVYPLRLARLLGVETLLVTNAAGAVNTEFRAGDIMLITDHIKLFAGSPLTGPNLDDFGPRFPDMSHAYSPALQELARKSAKELGIELREGVYMYFPGPQFETPAEIRSARILGADVVGMSTVPEVIAAAHCGMQALGLSLCSNMAAGILEQPLTHEEVITAGETAAPRLSALIKACLAGM